MSFILGISQVPDIHKMWRIEDVVKFCLNGKLDLSYKSLYWTNELLLKVRLWMYSVAFVHLVFIASLLLPVDFSKAEDPALWVYDSRKWKLITTWFNVSEKLIINGHNKIN